MAARAPKGVWPCSIARSASSTGKRMRSSSMKGGKRASGVVSRLTPRTTKSGSACSPWARSSRTGISSRQGVHQVVKKCTRTTRPRKSDSRAGVPSRRGSSSATVRAVPPAGPPMGGGTPGSGRAPPQAVRAAAITSAVMPRQVGGTGDTRRSMPTPAPPSNVTAAPRHACYITAHAILDDRLSDPLRRPRRDGLW